MTTTINYTFKQDIGKGLVLDIDLAKVTNERLLHHAFSKGFKPLFQDSHANATRDKYPTGVEGEKAWLDASLAMALKKLDAFYDGTMRIVGESRVREPTDPIGREAMRLARVTLFAICGHWSRNADHKAWVVTFATASELPFATTDDLKGAYDEMVAAYGDLDATQEQAKRNVEGAAKLKAFDVSSLVRKAK
jgi:hypothetical protein